MGMSMLGSVVPTPGGATGPFHTATSAALAFLGVEHNKAASIAIILHLVIFTPATVFGLYYLAKEGLSLDRLRRLGEEEDGDETEAEVPQHKQENKGVLAARG
jgi:uncharacterized membrane protein YbhN (UPF0104 family)